MKPIDIAMVSWERFEMTYKTVNYIWERTETPFRIIVVDNGSSRPVVDGLMRLKHQGKIHHLLLLGENYGIHMGHNYALDLVRSVPYYISTDNDLLCAKLEPDWLSRLVALMDKYKHLGAIACRPQILVGRGDHGFAEAEDVLEMGHVGAHLRIMRTAAVKECGGWRYDWNRRRNDEERYIAGALRTLDLKVAYAKNIRCCHLWKDDNWGYPPEITMEMHGHRKIWPPPSHYADNIKVDPETFEVIE